MKTKQTFINLNSLVFPYFISLLKDKLSQFKKQALSKSH